MLYQITGNGLERVPKNKIVPVVGMVVYMGSSSSPDRAIVTGVENGIITYRKYPYVKDIRNDFETFCMSADSGCRTQVENLKNYIKTGYMQSDENAKFFQDQIDSLNEVLSGGTGRLESAEDNQRVMIKIQPVGEHGDAWSELEGNEGFAYSVSHQHNESGMLFARVCRGELRGIEERIPDGFVYAGFEED